MARNSTFPLYDRILGGQLGALLQGWRDDGESLVEMAFLLREHDIKVSPDTVRRWLRQLDAEAVACPPGVV